MSMVTLLLQYNNTLLYSAELFLLYLPLRKFKREIALKYIRLRNVEKKDRRYLLKWAFHFRLLLLKWYLKIIASKEV